MKKLVSLSIVAAFAIAMIAQTAPAKSIGLLCAGTIHVHKTTANLQPGTPAKTVSHSTALSSVLIHTDRCGCAQCCPSHIKSAYPAPGYENVYNRYEARSTMGYKVLFDF
ncbi:MAG: hypothetical protein JW829_10905 [Pirellulales bacterium]|nr:hypothetical protein [Pirellulales bacterium]